MRKTLTEANQGYWDRIKRAKSWIECAKEIEAADAANPQQLFILYWIAFNSMYGRVKENPSGGYLRRTDDAEWFIGQICHLDSQGRIGAVLGPKAARKDAENLLPSHFLFDGYWRDGYTGKIKKKIKEHAAGAVAAFEGGSLESYLTTLLWGRLRVLRNQIFHGGSTNRDSFNTHTLGPALRIIKVLLPAFLEVMEARHDKEVEWPKIPYPPWDSPQHPHPRGPRG